MMALSILQPNVSITGEKETAQGLASHPPPCIASLLPPADTKRIADGRLRSPRRPHRLWKLRVVERLVRKFEWPYKDSLRCVSYIVGGFRMSQSAQGTHERKQRENAAIHQ